MSKWIYVLDIQPKGYVKIGQTGDFAGRLRAHESAAQFSGGHVAQVFATRCPDAYIAEKAALKALARTPGARLVSGYEVFAGVTFAQAVAVVNEAALSGAGDRVVGSMAGSVVAAMPHFVADIRMAMRGERAVHVVDLLARLILLRPDLYGPMSVSDLGRALRQSGIPTGQVKIRGRNRHGIRLAAADALAAAG